MDLSLSFLSCSIDLYLCLCASTILSWWLWLCSRVWSQAGWFLQFHSSFSRLLWLFEVFCTQKSLAFLYTNNEDLFQWVCSLHQVAKVLELQLQCQSFQWISGLIFFRIVWFDLLEVQDSQESSPAPKFESINLSYSINLFQYKSVVQCCF